MERWAGKVALVTGASLGIGRAITSRLVQHNMKVVGCARNTEVLTKLADELNKKGPGEMFPVRCDVSVESDVKELFKKIEERYGKIHVCINNAGLAHASPLLSGKLEDWNSMLGVNVIGLCLCTKEAVALMDKNGIDDGHVLHLNSLSGHRVIQKPFIHFYAATKHAVTALGHGLRNELRARNSHIRVTCISPGRVETEIATRMFTGDSESAKKFYIGCENLQASDIADAVVYALSAPPRVDVSDILIRPTERGQ